MKKIDKKQDECDELSGRLKSKFFKIINIKEFDFNFLIILIYFEASRQKIVELEKQVQWSRENAIGGATAGDMSEVYQLRNELASRDLLVDELRMRLGESSQALESRQDETKRMAALIQELTSQLEMSQIKVQQLISSSGDGGSGVSGVMDAQIDALRERARLLEAELAEAIAKAESERREAAASSQQNLERSQRQVENLVDQINRMSDEREELFGKIESLESRLATANQLNAQLKSELDNMHSAAIAAAAVAAVNQNNAQQTSQKSPSSKQNEEQYIVKIDLLENEIK